MNTPAVPSASPFDAIRRTRLDGSEYWSARDLQPLMGYPRWNEFLTPLRRAITSADNQALNTGDLFRGSAEKSGGRPREDFELTRFAAYLCAMNGDPNKTEVAAAQAYFAVRTRQAEVAPVRQLSGPELMAAALVEAQATLERAESRAIEAERHVAELAPRAFAFDRWLSGNTAYSVDVVAKALRQAGAMTGRNRLFDFMEKAGWIFRQSGQWKPKQWTVEQKLLTVRLGSYEDSHTGELVPTTTIRITAKGAAKLAALHGVVQEDVAATLGGGESDAA